MWTMTGRRYGSVDNRNDGAAVFGRGRRDQIADGRQTHRVQYMSIAYNNIITTVRGANYLNSLL